MYLLSPWMCIACSCSLYLRLSRVFFSLPLFVYRVLVSVWVCLVFLSTWAGPACSCLYLSSANVSFVLPQFGVLVSTLFCLARSSFCLSLSSVLVSTWAGPACSCLYLSWSRVSLSLPELVQRVLVVVGDDPGTFRVGGSTMCPIMHLALLKNTPIRHLT